MIENYYTCLNLEIPASDFYKTVNLWYNSKPLNSEYEGQWLHERHCQRNHTGQY
nr:hypothetical protein XNA1_1320009 [Xenorhabdus nematophila str. Anatoliense]